MEINFFGWFWVGGEGSNVGGHDDFVFVSLFESRKKLKIFGKLKKILEKKIFLKKKQKKYFG